MSDENPHPLESPAPVPQPLPAGEESAAAAADAPPADSPPVSAEAVGGTPEESAAKAPAPRPVKQENALLNLLLNVLLPITVLSYCSKENGRLSLGPTWALVLAVSMPVGYQIYDWIKRKKLNAFSLIGMVSVLLTGGLGLLKLSAQAFALKEASVPLVLGFVFLWTHRTGKPLSRALLLNPDLMDMPRIEKIVAEKSAAAGFERILWQGTWMLAGSMFLSSVLNYFLALFFLTGKDPGSEAYNQGIARQTGWGFLVIGVPMMAFLVVAFMRTLRGVQQLTGLKQEELMLPR